MPPAELTLKPGDVAPDFTVPTTLDRTFHLYEELERGPVAIIFFRGTW